MPSFIAHTPNFSIHKYKVCLKVLLFSDFLFSEIQIDYYLCRNVVFKFDIELLNIAL